jgi:FkbM family methyltransferase
MGKIKEFEYSIKNEYVCINIKQTHKTIGGQLSILPVEGNKDLFAIVYQSCDFLNTEINIKFNGVLYKNYKVTDELFYVLLKKREFCFFELVIYDKNFLHTPIYEIKGNSSIICDISENGALEIIKPRISLYSLSWNEEKILPFYLEHYSDFVNQIIIYDNQSTDNSINTLKEYEKTKIKIIKYDTNNKIDDFNYLAIKNNCWKDNPCEYVIICDVDELLYTENILQYLIKNSEYDILRPMGYEMISKSFPELGKKITEQVYRGVFTNGFCKSVIFKPNMLSEIDYTPGAHSHNAIGYNLKIKDFDDELKLLHNKHLSLDYVLNRYDNLKNRLSDLNIRTGAGNHYFNNSEIIGKKYNELLNDSNVVVINKNKKIFIDGGARIGESIDIFLDKRKDLLGCDVYLFECNPNHLNTLNEISKNNSNYNFIVKNEALWDENAVLDFYTAIDRWGDLGNTLISDKNELLDRDNPIKVNTIKFSDFISQFHSENYIVLKLDIEGAEYNVLWDLINTNEITKINELYIEFHDNFFSDKDSTELKNILNQKVEFVKYDWL